MNTFILNDCIEYALKQEPVKAAIQKRDKHKNVIIKEIRGKVNNYDKTTNVYQIKIGLDYLERVNGEVKEDIIASIHCKVEKDKKPLFKYHTHYAVGDLDF